MEFKLPDIGEGLEEGEIVKWLVSEGDSVKADQNIVQIETDKAVADLPAPVGGKILKINFKEGDTVKVGEVLCVIGGPEEKISSGQSTPKNQAGVAREGDKVEKPEKEVGNKKKPVGGAGASESGSGEKDDGEKESDNEKEGYGRKKTSNKSQSVGGDDTASAQGEAVDEGEGSAREEVVEEKVASRAMKGEAQTAKVLASPAVRKLAGDLKIDLASVKGSGDGGRVMKKDIQNLKLGTKAVEAVKKVESDGGGEAPQQKITTKRKYDEFGYIEHVPLKGMRKTIAKNMIKSQMGAAQVTAMDDIDVSKLWDIRNKEKEHFALEGIKLTFLPFIVKACVAALKENPVLNSSIINEEIIIKKYFNIGIAVETEAGLMVPVVKIAEKKSIAKIAKEIEDLAEKARTRKIDIMDLKGGSFTITNYGSVGGNYGTPIINPPEAAIMGLGRIFDRAVLDEESGKVKNIKVLPVSLTFDHRILDGARAARFLKTLKMFLEDPDHMFHEM